MDNSFSVEKAVRTLPEGLGNEILTILADHKGRDKAILGKDLTGIVRRNGHFVNNRIVRLQISQLRKGGALIGSAPGVNGGYYLCATPEEFEDFVQEEYLGKIKDMRSTLYAMQKSARQRWGQSVFTKKVSPLQGRFL
jgi:hypothetical protein